jgi:hypothetical protein
MTTSNPRAVRSLNGIQGEIADAELNNVAGGDKSTTKTTTKPEPPIKPLVVTMEQVLVSSY